MLIFSISFPDLIKKFLLYGYTWKKGEFTNNFNIYTHMPQTIYTGAM
jgi:hypothetical protein